jgi:hypothetical protein
MGALRDEPKQRPRINVRHFDLLMLIKMYIILFSLIISYSNCEENDTCFLDNNALATSSVRQHLIVLHFSK